MRFPSLQSLADGAARAFVRFPIAILLAAKATVIGMWWTHLEQNRTYIIHSGYSDVPLWYWNAIQGCYLGMLLSIAVTVWLEKRRGGRKLWLQLGVLVLAGLYYWSLPDKFSDHSTIRTVVLALGLHWLIAVIGFGRGEVNGFWDFNKQLFIRGLTTWLYTIVLYVGIALGLLAVERLFTIDIRPEVYMDCWLALAGLFSVWFFLAGFPKSYGNPAVIDDYPKGLKIFTQYILLSLVTAYLVILYVYMGKIVFTAHWPAGWVSWLVMAFSVLGILSLLLIYPLRNEEDNTWIRGYSRFFYFALLPLIVLLSCAIYKRVLPYGVTEQRYFLLVLAGWLLFIAVYFLASRVKDIRLVPLSLCILAFLSCWGPWGAFSVSLQSQKHRLKGLLEKYGLMQDGKVLRAKPDALTAAKDRAAISSVTEYIVTEFGYKELQPWFRQNLDSLMEKQQSDRMTGYGRTEAILGLMNVPYTSPWSVAADSTAQAVGPVTRYFVCNVDSTEAALTAGANYAAPFDLFTGTDSCSEVYVEKRHLRICPDNAHYTIHLSWASGPDAGVVDLTPVVMAVRAAGDQSQVQLGVQNSDLPIAGMGGPGGGSMSGKVVLTEVRGMKTGDVVRFDRIAGIILFSKK